MFWESSMDGTCIIQNMASALGGNNGLGLDSTPNQLLYPNSPYDNILKSTPGPSPTSMPSTIRISAPQSSPTATSEISSMGGVLFPSVLTGACNPGPPYTFWQCPGTVICTCGLDINHQPTCYNPLGTCYNKVCSTYSDCSANKACMTNGCGLGSRAQCAQILGGCLDSPLIN